MRWHRYRREAPAVMLAVLAALALGGTRIAAQSTLGVLRFAPSDSGTPGGVIAVTFDRPVAGRLDRSVDARRVLRLEPAQAGIIEWRDPITIRFVPTEPITPGTTIIASVDTAAAASLGSRTAEPVRFTVRVPGARPLYMTVDDRRAVAFTLGPMPRFKVMYSAPVDLDSLSRVSRLVFDAPCARTEVRLRPVGQYPVRPADWAQLLPQFGAPPRDSLTDRMRRVVDMVPEDSVPPGCRGLWHVASFDPMRPADSWRYNVTSAPSLAVSRVDPCSRAQGYCDPDGIFVQFTVPMDSADVRRRVRVVPDPGVALTGGGTVWTFRTPLVPRRSYTVTIDSGARDVWGRTLPAPSVHTVTARDYSPGVRQVTGMITVPRSRPVVRVRTMNLDSVEMILVPIPDSLIPRVFASNTATRANLVIALANTVTDTIRAMVPVRSRLNEDVVTEVPIPARMLAPDAPRLFGLRFAIPANRPDEAQGRFFELPDLGAVVQLSDLSSITKVNNGRGAVLVSASTGGRAVAGASVTVLDAFGRVFGRGTTARDGAALLTQASPVPPPITEVNSGIQRDYGLESLRYVDVRTGNDRLVLPLGRTPQPGLLSVYSIGGSAGLATFTRGFVTTDRAIYRPGETVHLKLVARNGPLGEMTIPEGARARISITGADTLYSRIILLSDFGTASDSFALPSSAKLGPYGVAAQLEGASGWESISTSRIMIREFRPPEFVVTLTADTSRTRVLGDTVNAAVSAQLLLGAPMVGAAVTWTATFSSSYWSTGQSHNPGFRFGESWWWGQPRPVDYERRTGQDSTTRDGTAHLRIASPAGRFTSPVIVSVNVSVGDLTNQSVSAGTSSILHSASTYIGLRARDDIASWRVGRPARIEVIAANLEGARVPGVPLNVSVIRRHWTREAAGGVGPMSIRWHADTVSRATLATADLSAAEPTTFLFTPRLPGAYDIRVAGTDPEGRPVVTNIGGWVGSGPPGTGGVVTLLPLVIANQPTAGQFAVGDTALVRFASPFDAGDAWVTIEREGILHQWRVATGRDSITLRVPISEREAPNIWVGVALTRRWANPLDGLDSTHHGIRAGYAQLRVDSSAHRLSVHVDAGGGASHVAPGDTAIIRVRVRDESPTGRGRGVVSEVALWAVDEGVLSLTGATPPNILLSIYSPQGLGLPLGSSLEWLGRATPPPSGPGSAIPVYGGQRGGGGGRGGGGEVLLRAATSSTGLALPMAVTRLDEVTQSLAVDVRSDFRFTAFFIGSAITDMEGTAVVRARLPDNITTFRVMAVAVTKNDRYGSGDTKLLATRAVTLRPALPRFVRFGDELSALTAANIRDGSTGMLRIAATVMGAELRDDSVRIVTVDDRGATARFQVHVPERTAADATRVTFSATGAAGADAISIDMPIRPTGSPRAHTVVAAVRDTASLRLSLPGDIDPERSRISIALGTSPVVVMRSSYDRLRAYPYSCTEALVSAARALIELRRAERVTGEVLTTRDSAGVLHDVQRAVDEIIRRQRPDGAIAFWPGGWIVAGPWVTSYAGELLLLAQREGALVPPSVLTGINNNLTRQLRDSRWRPDTITGAPWERRARLQAWIGDRLAVGRYLRLAGRPDSLVEDELARWSPEMKWEDRVWYAEMLSRAPETLPQSRAILSEAWSVLRLAGRRIEIPDSLRGHGVFPSHVRPAARLLLATLRVDSLHPLLGALAETIIQQGRAERDWAWNTQDYGSAVVALGELAVMQGRSGGVAPDVVIRAADGRAIVTTSGQGRDTSAALTGLLRLQGDQSELVLSVASSGAASTAPVFVAITVHEIPRARPVTPDIAGMVVERWFERQNDGVAITEATEGDIVRVRLRLTVPADRQFVALVDLLPAGLEPIDPSLRTSAVMDPYVNSMNTSPSSPTWQRLLYGGWWTPWERSELRDDRVQYFARQLWTGEYDASYLARATTAGRFVLPPAQAEEMYNPAVRGRSEGGWFVVHRRP